MVLSGSLVQVEKRLGERKGGEGGGRRKRKGECCPLAQRTALI